MTDRPNPSIDYLVEKYRELTDNERRLFTAEALRSNGHNKEQAEQPGYTDPWQAFTLEDAYQPRPPVEYIAANLFALPSLNIVYGAPGTLKSFLLADLAICAAAGGDWLPPAPWINGNLAEPITTRQYPALWCDFDNGRRRTHDRFAALGRARDLPADTQITYYSMPTPWLDASNKASVGELSLRIADRGARMVVVDNLQVVSGDADENSGEMGRVMSLFRQIGEDTGAAIVLIHHQRKGNGFSGRAGDNLRGHSSIEASLDLALAIEREELADTISIKATKVRGADVLPFSAVFTFEDDPAGELLTAKFFGIAADDTQSNAAIERGIIEALYNAELNQTELIKAVQEILDKVGKNRIRDIADRMVSGGKLRMKQGENRAKIYARA